MSSFWDVDIELVLPSPCRRHQNLSRHFHHPSPRPRSGEAKFPNYLHRRPRLRRCVHLPRIWQEGTERNSTS